MKLQLDYNHKPKESARNSIIWKIFHVIVDDEGNEVDAFYYCLSCHDIVYSPYAVQGSTVQLLRHACVPSQREFKIDFSDHEELMKAASKFVNLDLRPFYALECQGLLELVMAGVKLGKKYPSMTIDELKKNFPSRNSVKKMVSSEAECAKDLIKKLFEKSKINGGFGCTLDLWSDQYKHYTYMAMTANMFLLVEDGITQKRVVFHMGRIEEIVKSKEVIRTRIIEVFRDYGLSEDEIKKYVTFTTVAEF